MPSLLLNTIALDPNRWTPDKTPAVRLADVLEAVVAAGFARLEVWQYHLSTLSEREVDDLVAHAERLGVGAPIVGVYPALHLVGAEREREWEEVSRTIERAERLGARAVKMFAGTRGSDVATPAEAERSVEMSRRLAGLAREHGMSLVAEAHPDTLCDSVGATRRFLDAVGDVRVCFQPYDFTSTEKTLADYRALHEHVVHVHLQGRRGGRMSLLESADIDYLRVLSALAADGFAGALSIEFVEGCVVGDAADFDLDLVLENAGRDRAFVADAMPGIV